MSRVRFLPPEPAFRGIMRTENERLRECSGGVDSKDPLVAFLYILMRDHLPAGTVEELIRQHCCSPMMLFTNGWLAKYAEDVASRLKT